MYASQMLNSTNGFSFTETPAGLLLRFRDAMPAATYRTSLELLLLGFYNVGILLSTASQGTAQIAALRANQIAAVDLHFAKGVVKLLWAPNLQSFLGEDTAY